MKETVTSYMEQDHDLIDGIAERALAAAEARDFDALRREATEFLARLRHHIDVEENVLFPVFEQRTGMVAAGPSRQMRVEHELMQPLLAQMEQAVAGNDSVGFQLSVKALFDILKPHNMKEEQMMYPMIDELAGQEGPALVAGAKAHAAA